MSIEFNDAFMRALEALDAGENVFVTGKAGTGKSTLLRHFLDTTTQQAVVTAPTGVAALNVSGQTIHRLFGFHGAITPEEVDSSDYYPRRTRAVLGTMQTLIVDEVSMARADLMDCMDLALRRFGPTPGAPFGGVQVVLVGDPYQLPPVVVDAEAEHFRTRYPTPFFFSSDALKHLDYQLVELTTVYRQQDAAFVDLLNAVRTGDAGQAVFDVLNTRYDPDFTPPDDEFWVTLTTTNKMADTVNDTRLEALNGDWHTSEATVTGDVDESDKAVPDQLKYKIGAQVMLVANDSGDRYVNGSMGTIIDVTYDDKGEPAVTIDLLDGGSVEVTAHTWQVNQPVIIDGRLRYDTVGTFTQLPFKPAWAVTIHKSQGKTLERAVVSLGRGTFADGQLYVALSRCTSLDGLVLASQVKAHHVKVEREVTRFLARHRGETGDAAGTVFVAVHATGIDRTDRIIEIALVVDRGGGDLAEYSTLINPLRDIGRGTHGITASDVELAPDFTTAWPWLARRMDGCTVVAHGLPLTQTMIEREAEASGHKVDLGLGVDLTAHHPGGLVAAARAAGLSLPVAPTAVDLAHLTRQLYALVNPDDLPTTVAYRAGSAADRIGWITPRTPQPPANLGDSPYAYADMVAAILVADLDDHTATTAITDAATVTGIDAATATAMDTYLLEALLAAADRDHVTSDAERARLHRTATLLGLPVPDLEATAPNLGRVLTAGVRACFTGSATDLDGAPIDRSELQALAEQHGITSVPSVTKKTEVVVAADATSMSGKAKKARDYGIPVISVTDFLTWAANQP